MKRKTTRAAALSRREFVIATACVAVLGKTGLGSTNNNKQRVYVVPNFHPASCGWLTNFSRERVYCANSYLDHLDRVRDDTEYSFVLSEVNNMIAIMNFKSDRVPELKKAIEAQRVELVNGFFLESTVNLSGGEALVRLGVEGLRWQQKMFGVRPRFAWTIDVCGTHEQMAQLASGLGLEAMVYTRKNPTESTVHWFVSPDGSKILSLCPGHYSELGTVMTTKEPLTPAQMAAVETFLAEKAKITPEGAPILVLAGGGDYALAPARKQFPREFLAQWRENRIRPELQFSILGNYLDELQAMEKAGTLDIPSVLGGTAYDFDSFWIECPRVKSSFRKCEHLLQSAESLSAIASLTSHYSYPAQELYNAWTLLFLSMDRNTLWGSAGGMVFENEKSWDVKDRLEWIEEHSSFAAQRAGAALLASGKGIGLYNPLNWKRRDPVRVPQILDGVVGQATEEGMVLCQPELPSVGIGSWKNSGASASQLQDIALPETIQTKQYEIRMDPKTGAITSVKLRNSGKEMLAGPANVIVVEKPQSQKGDPGDFMLPRSQRNRVDSTSEHPQTLRVKEGPIARVVEIEGEFVNRGICRRTVTFYADYPRIDFTTELNDIPNLTVVVAEFPLAGEVNEVRRGIPYGFTHGEWAKPNPKLHGWTKGIVPAVRWSHYAMSNGSGAALLDHGVTGRELKGSTPIVYLYNSTDKYYGYPNPWLSGRGKHVLQYALVLHDGEWEQAAIQRMAWEYNCPPVVIPGNVASASSSFLETSENVIVEALRRLGNDIELRFVECLGHPGTAEVRLSVPHVSAAQTDMNGEHPKPLAGASTYRVKVRPQEIVTLRFRTSQAVAEPAVVSSWDEMVPPAKLATLHEYSSEKGHPPRGD
jgi:alpha-mannosidase